MRGIYIVLSNWIKRIYGTRPHFGMHAKYAGHLVDSDDIDDGGDDGGGGDA